MSSLAMNSDSKKRTSGPENMISDREAPITEFTSSRIHRVLGNCSTKDLPIPTHCEPCPVKPIQRAIRLHDISTMHQGSLLYWNTKIVRRRDFTNKHQVISYWYIWFHHGVAYKWYCSTRNRIVYNDMQPDSWGQGQTLGSNGYPQMEQNLRGG